MNRNQYESSRQTWLRIARIGRLNHSDEVLSNAQTGLVWLRRAYRRAA